jgi:hypothetical protein
MPISCTCIETDMRFSQHKGKHRDDIFPIDVPPIRMSCTSTSPALSQLTPFFPSTHSVILTLKFPYCAASSSFYMYFRIISFSQGISRFLCGMRCALFSRGTAMWPGCGRLLQHFIKPVFLHAVAEQWGKHPLTPPLHHPHS